ncbi:MAG TPA: Crp/Fnr family transcriptional regulator [Candidatus Saccharimonadales bacterium]|nr:Crp/Fnr family transcriptional regulator [Candidatus Saccharimonadales bacterium]
MNDAKISEELKALLLKGRHYKIPKGQIIQSTEDRLVFNMIKSGFVKRYLISNDGALGVQVIYGPGDIFPITLALKILVGQDINPGPEVYYYEAMNDVELYTVEQPVLQEGIENDPILYRDLLAICGKRLHSTLNSLENLTLRSSYKRLAHQLVYLAEAYGKQVKEGTQIDLQLTHQDLADILSLTRETISTNIIRLRKKGLIKTGRRIIIPNLEKLTEEAFN